jgi:hypothetical protein
MKHETTNEINFLTESSWLTPTRKRVLTGVLCSLIVHTIGYGVFRFIPIAQFALNLQQFEFVDESYNRGILLKLEKPLRYPGDYAGFAAPTKTLDLAKLKEEEKKRQKALAEAKRRAAAAERKRAEEARKQADAQQSLAKNNEPEAAPTPKPTPSGFKPINTRPIREQMQRLYDLKQEGKLVFNEANLRVGVAGEIKPDGSIVNAKVFIPSGNSQIDRAALAIIESVSEAKALGPLSDLTSLSMVLTIDEERAQLVTVGFAPNSEKAGALQFAALGAVALGKRLKAADPASMIFLNNIKITQSSNRLTATIAVPRQVAKDTLAKAMAKKTEQ